MESDAKNAWELGRETRFFTATAPFPRSCSCYFRLVCFIFAISLLSKSLAQHTFTKSTFLISYIGWDILLLFARGSILVWLWFDLSHVFYFQNYRLLAYKPREFCLYLTLPKTKASWVEHTKICRHSQCNQR